MSLMARTPTESEYRKGHKGTSYFVQDKKLFICSLGRYTVLDTGSSFGGISGPTMILRKGGSYAIFFQTAAGAQQALQVCKHPVPHGLENDYTTLQPTADGLGFILTVLRQWLNHAKGAIAFVPNP